MTKGSKVWFNGKIIAAEEAQISIFTHALHYGTGIFEGIRAYKQQNGGGAIFRLREHMSRFLESAKIMHFPISFTLDELCQACIDVTGANQFNEAYIRPIAYVKEGPLGVYPGDDIPVDVAVVNWEWGTYLGDAFQKGAKVKTSSFNRPQVNSIMTKGKICGQYVTGVLAKIEAIRDGYSEAILLDTEGYVSEGSGENIFMIKNGKVKTTPLTSILGGITRATIIEHLRQQKIEVVEQRFSRDELWSADEVFMTGTAAEVTPVCEIDRRSIGNGQPGPMTRKIQSEYMGFVHGDLPPYGKDWLTAIT